MNQTLSEAIEQFSKWRKDKRGRKKIPDELWQLACDSSDELDIGSVSRILRLIARFKSSTSGNKTV